MQAEGGAAGSGQASRGMHHPGPRWHELGRSPQHHPSGVYLYLHPPTWRASQGAAALCGP